MIDLEQNPELRPFVEAILDFVEGRVEAEVFALRYRELFSTDTLIFGGGATRALNALFRTVDTFSEGIGGNAPELRDAADRTLRDLEAATR